MLAAAELLAAYTLQHHQCYQYYLLHLSAHQCADLTQAVTLHDHATAAVVHYHHHCAAAHCHLLRCRQCAMLPALMLASPLVLASLCLVTFSLMLFWRSMLSPAHLLSQCLVRLLLSAAMCQGHRTQQD
eukprot:2105-Heterococcus_DN1.PRE.1